MSDNLKPSEVPYQIRNLASQLTKDVDLWFEDKHVFDGESVCDLLSIDPTVKLKNNIKRILQVFDRALNFSYNKIRPPTVEGIFAEILKAEEEQ